MAEPRLALRTAAAAGWSVLEISSRYAVQFVVVAILARLLTPGDFGLVALLMIFTSIGAVVVEGGFGLALIQRQSSDPDDETTVFVVTSVVGVLAAAALIALAPLIAHFFAQPQLAPLLRVAAVILPISGLGTVPDALLTMRLNFRVRTYAQLVSSLLSAGVGIALALRGYGVWALVWQMVVASVARVAVLILGSRWLPRGRFRLAALRSLSAFGGYMLMMGLLDAAFGRIQSVLIGRLFDTRTLGYFTVADNTQLAPASFIGGILNRVCLPVFSRIASNSADLLDALRKMLLAAMFVFVPCMVAIAVLAQPIVVLVYGEKWLPAAPILSILALASSLWPVHVLNLVALNAQGRSDLSFRLEVAKKLLGVALILIAGPYGVMAIAWACLASAIASAMINTYYSHRYLAYGFFAQMRDQWRTAAATVPAVAVALLVPYSFGSSWPILLLAISAAGTVYVIAAFLLRNEGLFQFLSLARSWNDRARSEAG